jgi:hypothetical protein
MRFGYAFSAQFLETINISSGKTLTATGMLTFFGATRLNLFSQYIRAEETAVFVNQ